MDKGDTLSPHIKAILREADAVILKLAGESHHLLYQYLRVTAAKITPVDAFYIGYFSERKMMVFPYSFDGREYYDPNKFKYNPEGLSAWIQEHKEPYRFSLDGGALLNRGKNFGQKEKRSEDAVVVPLLVSAGRKRHKVLGVMSVQTYTPNSYTEATVKALEWLARSLVIVLEREREDEARRKALSTEEPGLTDPMLSSENIVNQMLDKMQSIRRKGEAIRRLVSDPASELASAIDELVEECHRRQTETIELFLHSVLTKDNPLAALSEREQGIVALLAEGLSKSKGGYSNLELARMLYISEDTVKTHLRSIYRKMGVSGRTGIVQIAKGHIPDADQS